MESKKEEENGSAPSQVIWSPRFNFKKLSMENRVKVITQHREELGGIGKVFKAQAKGSTISYPAAKGNNLALFDTMNPAGNENLPSHFKELRPVKIRDLDPSDFANSYGNRLDLELIEDSLSFTRVMVVAQDSVGDVVFVALYCNNPNTSDDLLQETFGFGCKISIANPFIKTALDGRTMIRVDEDEDIFIHKKKDKNMCRFCFKANAIHKCGRCKRAKYCSRECQTHDWKIMKHKKLCDLYAFIKANVRG